jgi:hypothetical protein
LAHPLNPGAWWGKLAWGDYWNWDPKELWSLVSWLMFLGYFHFRYLYGTRFAGVNVVIIVGGIASTFLVLASEPPPNATYVGTDGCKACHFKERVAKLRETSGTQ